MPAQRALYRWGVEETRQVLLRRAFRLDVLSPAPKVVLVAAARPTVRFFGREDVLADGALVLLVPLLHVVPHHLNGPAFVDPPVLQQTFQALDLPPRVHHRLQHVELALLAFDEQLVQHRRLLFEPRRVHHVQGFAVHREAVDVDVHSWKVAIRHVLRFVKDSNGHVPFQVVDGVDDLLAQEVLLLDERVDDHNRAQRALQVVLGVPWGGNDDDALQVEELERVGAREMFPNDRTVEGAVVRQQFLDQPVPQQVQHWDCFLLFF